MCLKNKVAPFVTDVYVMIHVHLDSSCKIRVCMGGRRQWFEKGNRHTWLHTIPLLMLRSSSSEGFGMYIDVTDLWLCDGLKWTQIKHESLWRNISCYSKDKIVIGIDVSWHAKKDWPFILADFSLLHVNQIDRSSLHNEALLTWRALQVQGSHSFLEINQSINQWFFRTFLRLF